MEIRKQVFSFLDLDFLINKGQLLSKTDRDLIMTMPRQAERALTLRLNERTSLSLNSLQFLTSVASHLTLRIESFRLPAQTI